MIRESEYRRNRAEIDAFADGYPWAAVTAPGTKVAARWTDISVSRATSREARMWRFRTQEDRDAFVSAIPTAEAAGR